MKLLWNLPRIAIACGGGEVLTSDSDGFDDESRLSTCLRVLNSSNFKLSRLYLTRNVSYCVKREMCVCFIDISLLIVLRSAYLSCTATGITIHRHIIPAS